MDVKKEKGRDGKTESKDNGERRKLERVQRLGWLQKCGQRRLWQGVWIFSCQVCYIIQNGKAGAATQAVGLAPVFPQLQVTEATVGIQPKPQKRHSRQKRCSQHVSDSRESRKSSV